jgi:hypothetical protein
LREFLKSARRYHILIVASSLQPTDLFFEWEEVVSSMKQLTPYVPNAEAFKEKEDLICRRILTKQGHILTGKASRRARQKMLSDALRDFVTEHPQYFFKLHYLQQSPFVVHGGGTLAKAIQSFNLEDRSLPVCDRRWNEAYAPDVFGL